jgi:hypothetical protein
MVKNEAVTNYIKYASAAGEPASLTFVCARILKKLLLLWQVIEKEWISQRSVHCIFNVVDYYEVRNSDSWQKYGCSHQ